MKITKDVVEYVAHLARLSFCLPKWRCTRTDRRILAYMDQLNSLDTTGIDPTTHAIPAVNVFRADAVDNNLEAGDAVSNAPAREDGFFKVPPIIETD